MVALNKNCLSASIGRQIRKFRILRGLSREELGAKVGVCRQAVCKWEMGQRLITISNLYKVSKALNIKPDDLMQEYLKECKERSM